MGALGVTKCRLDMEVAGCDATIKLRDAWSGTQDSDAVRVYAIKFKLEAFTDLDTSRVRQKSIGQ